MKFDLLRSNFFDFVGYSERYFFKTVNLAEC